MAPDRGAEDNFASLIQDDTSALLDACAGEDHVLIIPDSVGHTAALFCIEDFGVSPPPPKGWIPRETVESSRTGDGSEKVVEWYRNVEAPEWIYHSVEDMYYHLPTSSLWERREVKCSDPSVESHTYFRADAHALQVLSHFAMSLDAGLVPLAFKAWVRLLRKTKDSQRGPGGVLAPPTSPGKGGSQRSSGGQGDQAGASPKLPASQKDPTSPTSPGQGWGKPSIADVPAVFNDANAALATLKASRSSDFDEAAEELGVGEFNPILESVDEGREYASAADSAPVAPMPTEILLSNGTQKAGQPLLPSKNQKGFFCLRCFRGGRGSARSESEDSEVVPPANSTERSVPSVANTTADALADTRRSEQAPEVGSAEPSVAETPMMGPAQEANAAKQLFSIEIVDRHMRKLEFFLDLVKRNPQKLVDHIEKRRQGRTTTLGYIVA